MKKMRKIFALLIAMVMVFGMSTMAFASEATPKDGKITVTPPANTLTDSENTYTLYKVFSAETDGSNYSYKLSGSHTDVPAGFILDDAGNVFFAEVVTEEGEGTFKTKVGGQTVILKNKTALTDNDIAAIAAYVTDADKVGQKTVTGTTPAVFDGLEYGYYYVKTTTGALVVIDSTKPDVAVTDKNTVPELDKQAKQAADPTYMELDDKGKNAVAQVGTVVPFEATIKIGKGAIGYVFHDNMTDGLSYNNDVKVYIGADEVTAGTATFDKTPVGNDEITITFVDAYTKGLDEGTVITIKYSATITSNALSVNPATNTASLDYGDTNGNNSVPEVPVKVYDAKLTVTKLDEKGQALAGAGFVLKNADGKYYKLTETTTGEGEAAVTTYSVSWVDTVAEATEYVTTTGAGGNVIAFTGLGVGKYTLVENTVPTGYNPAADSEFEVKADDFANLNLELEAEVTNNKGAELPSTGGIGTTIFYVVGAMLIIGAGVVLVSRRRMNVQ